MLGEATACIAAHVAVSMDIAQFSDILRSEVLLWNTTNAVEGMGSAGGGGSRRRTIAETVVDLAGSSRLAQ